MSTLLRALLRPGLPASRSRLCARRLLSTSDDAEESASEPPLPAPAPERLPVDLLIYSSHLKNVRDYSVKTSQDRLFLQGKLRVHKETEDLRAELARYGPDGGACAALPYVYPGVASVHRDGVTAADDVLELRGDEDLYTVQGRERG